MTDLWSFLLQTLTASGAALLLLAVKYLLEDKLPPRWHFAIWGLLGLVLIIPAGHHGRYVLINWTWIVETLKTWLAGEYTLTRVIAPIPLPLSLISSFAHFIAEADWTDWLYLVYLTGVLIVSARYLTGYIRLRHALRQGAPASSDLTARIEAVAQQYHLPCCRAIAVPGLSSAFICGLFHPVIALPTDAGTDTGTDAWADAGTDTGIDAGAESKANAKAASGIPSGIDDKVLLHELLHLKYKDVVWGWVICFFRCIHWCNPLLWYCANRAANDLEARCDQRALELLDGEERRDYGRILLSMADERYARTPGTSSMANGGRNIRRRIEAIAWFKHYPRGMRLVSACIAVILAAPLLLGARPQSLYRGCLNPSGSYLKSPMNFSAAMAYARTFICTTPAGAADTYAKSVLAQNGCYRAMCAPLSEQASIADSMRRSIRENQSPLWDTGLSVWPDTQTGYALYNLRPVGEDAYEGLLVIQCSEPIDSPPAAPDEGNTMYLAIQSLRIEKEGSRFVVTPLDDFQIIRTAETNLKTGCEDLPSLCYEGQSSGFNVRLKYQTVCTVDSYIQTDGWFPTVTYDTVPKPEADFSYMCHSAVYVTADVSYTGDPAELEDIYQIGVSCGPMVLGDPRPVLTALPEDFIGGGSVSNGKQYGSRTWEPDEAPDWTADVFITGGGHGGSGLPSEDVSQPEAFAADLYLNNKKTAELTLLPVEGGIAP